jgi:hypothetical protein
VFGCDEQYETNENKYKQTQKKVLHEYTEQKSCDTKPKKSFVHATIPLKGLLVCNEIETLKQFLGCLIGVCKGFV